MKCFVHVGFDPKPHEADDPAEAISLAERYLLAESRREPEEEHLPVKWRRDDLYPDNFLDYTKDELVSHLSQKGEVVLQLAEFDLDGLPIMGEIVNIFTASEEEKNTQEAEEALDVVSPEGSIRFKKAVAFGLARPKNTPTLLPGRKIKRNPAKKRTMKPDGTDGKKSSDD